LVIVGSNIQERHFPLTLLEHEIPFTLIERNLSNSRINCICLDNIRGAYMAVKYLLEKGHRRIAHITGNTKFQVSLDRIEGYQNALQEAGIGVSDEWMVPGNFVSRGGYEAMKGLLGRHPHCTAAFAASDAMAYGALQAISEMGLRVPEDIAVIGFDDLEFSGFTNPPLTTIRQPRYEMGQKSMELLIEILRGAGKNGRKIRLDPELVIRKSV
jgi:DNA-binding LacI/PurR family transcriptional regulator